MDVGSWLEVLLVKYLLLITHCTTTNEGKSHKSVTTGVKLLKDLPRYAKTHKIERLHPRGWHFMAGAKQEEITPVHIKKFKYNSDKGLTLEFIGHSESKKIATLFGIYKKNRKLPIFELNLDIYRRKVIVRYQGEKSFQRATLTFGNRLEKWTILTVKLNQTHVTVQIGCVEESSFRLRQELARLPKGKAVLGSNLQGENRFEGILFDARLYPYFEDRESLICTKTENIQGDDGYVNDVNSGDRLLLLEQQITQLNRIINNLKAQNANLTARVQFLEACDCNTQCSHDGQIFDEGDTWSKDLCNVCICQNGRADCVRRTDIESCITPCVTNPCQHSGMCITNDPWADDYHCMCKPPYDGPSCELRENPCVWPAEPGICDTVTIRYYYDKFSQQCLPFNYTGCGGNVNNFETFEECQNVAVTGACCYRQYSTVVGDIVVSGPREINKCKMISLAECQSTHRQVIDDIQTEVISFYPGMSCEDAGCQNEASDCMIGDRTYKVGEKTTLGCQDCTCEPSGQFVCSCTTKVVRKEIRDMTGSELAQFQAAVQQLRLIGPGNPWEEYRDLYMRHSMHANGGPYFLPWHRMFLRQLEQRLQQIDCSITLPYFDFTTDVGDLADAIIWQPNFFGGDGEADGCVPDHPFGPPKSWRPCIMRKFDTSVKLPTLIELAIALSSDDYTEMSMCLEAYVSYIHTYIGGDMATQAAAYDPAFYAIHAYVDMLYWWWQQKGNNRYKYPAAFANIPMVPFNIPPSLVLDLENDLCVTYLPPSRGHPCNVTEETNGDDDRKMRGDVTPEDDFDSEGFDPFGYNAEGYDRRGFDRYGYKQDGFNRDGFNRGGFDRNGYDRLGYNRDGYNRYGFNRQGVDTDGNVDSSGRYGPDGYDMNCLNRNGLSIHGYDIYGLDLYGQDIDYCDYFSNGPFSTILSHKLWQVLQLQDKNFLMSVPRTCPGLQMLPINWLQQYWITDIKDVSSMVPVELPVLPPTIATQRFCFDVDTFINACDCNQGIATCYENPCLIQPCLSYPEATCHVSFCGACKATWYFNGMEVDCFEERDFCEPNPCENGGTCLQSVWPSQPQLITCICPVGWDGDNCQHPVLDVCTLPKLTGNCGDRSRRWFFNYQTQLCEQFVYTGCGGNGNNFLTLQACETRCRYGACCYRTPLYTSRTIGYDRDGFDRYGFNVDGVGRTGSARTDRNGIKSGLSRFDSMGFDWQGYDRNGFDEEGFDRLGYDKEGYNGDGFNITGYSREGDYDGNVDYNEDGYDAEGYNRAGMNCYGYNRQGYNAYSVTYGYRYKCRSLTIEQCQRVEGKANQQVMRFSRGKLCEEVQCGDYCGCVYNDEKYSYGDTFRAGCDVCTCTITGAVECSCSKVYERKEIRDMTREETEKYQKAIRELGKMGFPSKWYSLASLYANHRPQNVGNPASLPWHRYFLRLMERELQAIDCSITIPYYDWTVDVGELTKSVIWAANMFGGDGRNELTDCVRHHPFKEFYPNYWAPCLRRKFNTSVSLPDAVSLQFAINDPSYERFRLTMEVYLSLFQSWVGGHMASELSPYDPLFYSVVAFVDRLWSHWQEKHVQGLLKYPQNLRYIPMAPWKVTPDDVIDSERQMCVSYIPLSEGAICNITLPNYGYNKLGFDRHGFNREGYDMNGFNIYGVDRDGFPDERGIFDENGFDREGFKRNGFDIMGFDRYGFYIDSYNIDGYDGTGFDRWGYDRYGFSKSGVTPFNFHRNGTQLVPLSPNVFDRYGYNRFGLDRYGFDREGYDVFGFDSTGFDRNRCNKHSLGPMYIIIKRWAELELEKLDNLTMRIITRICPAITKLPEWRYTLNWLKRGDQIPLIETIQSQREADRLTNINYFPRKTSVLNNELWLPLSPDKRMCFVTYFYTECPFGHPPQDCPVDLCLDRTCPGFPDAVCRVNRCGDCTYEWYNGITGNTIMCTGCIDEVGIDRPEGTTWQRSECETCTCQDGLIQCRETSCPIVACSHPVKIPGRCCSTCEVGCQYDGTLYENGVEFRSAVNPCEDCVCDGGNVFCQRRPCPDLPGCQSSVTLEGECCPICMDCGDHASGTSWRETPCQQCTCVDGSVECERIQCIPPDCSHPSVPSGECCAICLDCMYQGRFIREGSSFDQDQCTTCTCLQGNVRCDPKPCPPTFCASPVTPAGECCPVCDSDCNYEGRRYQHLQVFTPLRDNCLTCTCDNSRVSCVPVECDRRNLNCQRPITLPGECCPSRCPRCSADGREYENGETWRSARDPCLTCTCRDGLVSCDSTRCVVTCSHGVVPQGECCPVCTDCVYNGQRIGDGQTFVQPGDSCQQCICSRGNVQCQAVGPCPPLMCTVTETPPGACCPRCRGCEYRGQMYRHGDVVSRDQCSTCYCREGQVSCDQVPCPPTRCPNPRQVPGECCPVCEECQDNNGQVFDNGQRFTPRGEPCLDCMCRAGEIDCHNRMGECMPAQCTHPVSTDDDCCPHCNGCYFMRRQLRNGQKFVPPGEDNCRICLCQNGSVNCMHMDCPPVTCDNPVLVPGQCCPACPMGCTVMGIEYRDGQTFVDFMNRCSVCTCFMGQMRCAAMGCEDTSAVSCTHPVQRDGECCPSCFMCSFNGVQYKNGETFTNPVDPCEECQCRDGSVRCTATECPFVSCAVDYVFDPSQCCPVCPERDCMHRGRSYQEGEIIPAGGDACELCRCSGGLIDCGPIPCPVVTCENPGRAGCCPTCDVCSYNGQDYRDGERVSSFMDHCESCICERGNVRCTRRPCPEARCSNPVFLPGACCPECSDCTYQGLLFRDGQSFVDPTNACLSCTCSRGDVQCSTRDCPQVSCRYPVKKGCCPSCTDCQYANNRYTNGETFTDLRDTCQTCRCLNGEVICQSQDCPAVTCQHPVQGRCCPECSDCFFQGRRLRNGQQYPDLTDECVDCRCDQGTVTCTPRGCPAVTCDNPTRGRCCDECRNCMYRGQPVRNGMTVPSDSNACGECFCRNGNIECQEVRCPSARCTNPAQGLCCPECNNCLLNGVEYRNGRSFRDPSDPCRECRCEYGNIECTRTACPPVTCSNPVQGQCCPVCAECSYQGRLYGNGETFPDESDPCGLCTCIGGTAQCRRRPCPPTSCSHPVRKLCCQECGDCFFNMQMYRDGERFDVEAECKECTCNGGNVLCFPKFCPPVACDNPVTVDCCPTCRDCMFEGRTFRNGESFPDLQDACGECICRNGSFTCGKKPCPEVTCANPVQGQCCPQCTNCQVGRRTIADGQRFPDITDPCNTCLCQDGTVTCRREPCESPSCSHPITNSCDCPTCTDCLYEGRILRNNARTNHPTDPCQECQCRSGSVQCQKKDCPESCSHSALDDGCCPLCEDCYFEGGVRKNGAIFFSEVDPCDRCICRSGSVNCQRTSCPATTCENPVTRRGDCCPSCPVCRFLGEEYEDGSSFTHPEDICQTCVCKSGRVQCETEICAEVACSHPRSDGCCPVCDQCFFHGRMFDNNEVFHPDPCSTCFCTDGDIRCEEKQCPELSCLQQEQVPGECCPRCQGCIWDDVQRKDGSSWFQEDNPCVRCTCYGGFVTCMEVPCVTPCDNPIAVPGQCCPVCPTCRHNGTTYRDGESFSPSGDPCDVCHCEDGQLRCLREMCPSTANCPPEQLVSPPAGECCPTCGGFGTNCTRDRLGITTRPRPEDPCFVCECKESFHWICMKETCPALSCPAAVQQLRAGECCPRCPACYDSAVDRYYDEGETWTDRDDPCVTCQCRNGRIRCSIIDCPAVSCGSGQRLVRRPGVCCDQCEGGESSTCMYQGQIRQNGVQWTVDECTRCECQFGVVKCHTTRCPSLDCGLQDTLAVLPGTCCPVCVAKPATCLVYGDPHYRTFDGETLHFQGTCRYIMASDCDMQDFVVEVHHDDRGVSGVSWAQNFTVRSAGIQVDLLQGNRILVNNREVQLPYFRDPDLYIEQSGDTVLLNTKVGMQLLWNGQSSAEVSVPGSYKRKTCGLCGNFNGFPQDDLHTRSGQITSSPAIFGNSWKASSQTNSQCGDAVDDDPCVTASYRVRKSAQTSCQIIMGSPFNRCHRTLPPGPFFSSCLYDLCACVDQQACLCDILTSYAKECAKAGIKLQWRAPGLCAYGCDEDKGFMFDECGPACPRTCENWRTPLGEMTPSCYKPCVANCQCPADKVVHEGRCISPEDCPDIHHE